MNEPSMGQDRDRRTHRLRRAEVISLSAALTVFLVIAVLGVIVWRRTSADEGMPAVVPQPLVAVARTASVGEPVAAAPRPPDFSRVRVADETPPAASPDPLDLIPSWPDDRPFGLLLLGLDRRPGEASGRTDAMLFVRVEPANRTAMLISIPRDVCVASCLSDPYRINTVWQREGPEALRRRVAQLLGVQVDYWVTLDFFGFRRLVDFFGGVDIEVHETIYDPSFPNAMDTGFEPFYVEVGLNHFDGDVALRYARTRHQGGAFAREQRQQQVLLALKDQALSPQTLVQSPAFFRELSNAFETNVPLEAVPSLAKLALLIGSQRVVHGGIGPDDGLVRAVIAETGAYVLEPNLPLIQAYTAELIRQGEALPAPQPASKPLEFADRQHLEP